MKVSGILSTISVMIAFSIVSANAQSDSSDVIKNLVIFHDGCTPNCLTQLKESKDNCGLISTTLGDIIYCPEVEFMGKMQQIAACSVCKISIKPLDSSKEKETK